MQRGTAVREGQGGGCREGTVAWVPTSRAECSSSHYVSVLEGAARLGLRIESFLGFGAPRKKSHGVERAMPNPNRTGAGVVCGVGFVFV
jgi:hypothetical protein